MTYFEKMEKAGITGLQWSLERTRRGLLGVITVKDILKASLK